MANEDARLQLFTFGDYTSGGLRYVSGTMPQSAFAVLSGETSRYLYGNQYEPIISSRLAEAQPRTAEEQRAIDEWARPGALRDYEAAGKTKSTWEKARQQSAEWLKKLPIPLPPYIETLLDPVGTTKNAALTVVVLVVGLVLLALAAYSIAVPPNARGQIAGALVTKGLG